MKRQIGIAFIFALTLLESVSAVAQELLWSQNYGGLYNEMGYSCRATSSGFFLFGSTYSFGAGDFDMYLLRTDSTGQVAWSRTYGGDSTDYGYDMVTKADGSAVLAGSTKSFGYGKRDAFLVSIDNNGLQVWSRTFGGSGDDEVFSISSTFEGGYILCGTTNSAGAGYTDLYLIKTDASGNKVWERTYGGAGGESGSSVKQTPDSGFIAIGSTGSFGTGYSSLYVVRTDKNGDSLWARTFGGTKADLGYSVEVTSDGGFVLVGSTASFGAGQSDAYIVRTDPFGNLEWEQTFGGLLDDRGFAVAETPDGGFVLTGRTESYSSNIEVYLVKTDPIGGLVWSRFFGGSKKDEGQKLIIDSDNNLLLVGQSFSYSQGGSDVYLLKVRGDQPTSVNEQLSFELPDGCELNQNYPNPFNSSTLIEYSIPERADVSLTIYNILGQAVTRWEGGLLPAGTYRFEWDGKNDAGLTAATGVYFYELRADQWRASKKMLLVK